MSQQDHPVTIRELAIFALEHEGYEFDPQYLTGTDFFRVGLNMLGGCSVCGASIAAYNACPSKSNFWKCRDGCIDEDGWYDVEQCYIDIFEVKDDRDEE